MERQRLEVEFKIKFYDQLLGQMEKQHEATKAQLRSLQTKQNLCNVYGQTFSPIDYGNASYATSPQLRNHSKSPRHEYRPEKPKRINPDILKPLSEELRQKQLEKESIDEASNVLCLSNVNDFVMNEIIAESAKVKKEIVLNNETIKTGMSPRTSL